MESVVPVVFINANPAVQTRGFWDEAWIEEIIAGRWAPVNGFTYQVQDEVPEGEGAIVIAHVGPEPLDRINEFIADLPWCVLIVSGDEPGIHKATDIKHANRLLWWQYPDPRYLDGVNFPFALGFSCDTRTNMTGEVPEKVLDWYFGGQVTHTRRDEAVAALAKVPGGELLTTPGFAQGLPKPMYHKKLMSAKIAPSPSGPFTQETSRHFEALEAGTLPIIDQHTPKREREGLWNTLFPGAPLPFIDEWDEVGELIPKLLADWPANINRASAWWQQEKRQAAYTLRNHVARYVGEPRPEALRDRVTAIVTTSPTRVCPSTLHTVTTIDSIRSAADLGDCEIVVICDGVRPEQENLREDYEEYVRRLLWYCNYRWDNVVPLVMNEWVHHGQTFKRALAEVKTPVVFGLDHDTPLIHQESTDWEGLANVCELGVANMVRLHYDTEIHPDHWYLMLDQEPVLVNDVPMIRTAQHSQRPHFARTDWYREVLDKYIGNESRCHVEDVLYGPMATGYERFGEVSWEGFKTWVYAPEGDMQRSYHLDSRGNDWANFTPFFAYDGETPEDAPQSVRST